MRIALDYDQTFTADKHLWAAFVRHAQMREHVVVFVTFRGAGGDNEDIMHDAADLGIPVVFTGGKQKSHCYDADIWIDDMPVLIPSFDQLSAMAEGCRVNGDTP